MANSTRRVVQVVELDIDYYRATQFETAQIGNPVDNWTSRWESSASLEAIMDADLPSGKGGQLKISSDNPGFYLASWDPAGANMINTSALTCVKVRDVGVSTGILLRGAGSPTLNTKRGYECSIISGDTLRFVKHPTGGIASILTSRVFEYGPNDVVWILFEAINAQAFGGSSGVVLRAKAWKGKMSDEPTPFTLTYTDTSSPITQAGWVGLVRTVGTS